MSKPVLGRGLGDLLREDHVGTKQTPDATGAEWAEPAALSRGMRSLVAPEVLGGQGSASKEDKPSHFGNFNQLLPRWYLLTADLVLLTIAAAIVLQAEKMSLAGWFTVGGIICVGTLLALIAVLRPLQAGAVAAEPFRNWAVVRDELGGMQKILIVHRTGPGFAAEIRRVGGGRVEIIPLPTEPEEHLTAEESHRLLRQAEEAFRQIEARRATRLRSSLG